MAKEISWKRLVDAADTERKKEPVVYTFSKGKKFKDRKDPYEGAKN